MDGLELQQRLNERGVRLPVIVMTGQGDIPIAVRAMKAGAVDFLEKPFDEARLLEAVEPCAWSKAGGCDRRGGRRGGAPARQADAARARGARPAGDRAVQQGGRQRTRREPADHRGASRARPGEAAGAQPAGPGAAGARGGRRRRAIRGGDVVRWPTVPGEANGRRPDADDNAADDAAGARRSRNCRTTRSLARTCRASSRPGTRPRTAMFGYAADEIVGRPITLIIPPDRLDEEAGDPGAGPARRKADPFRDGARRKDGSIIPVSLTILPIRDAAGASSACPKSPATSARCSDARRTAAPRGPAALDPGHGSGRAGRDRRSTA